jgi:hypothetical protein
VLAALPAVCGVADAAQAARSLAQLPESSDSGRISIGSGIEYSSPLRRGASLSHSGPSACPDSSQRRTHSGRCRPNLAPSFSFGRSRMGSDIRLRRSSPG